MLNYNRVFLKNRFIFCVSIEISYKKQLKTDNQEMADDFKQHITNSLIQPNYINEISTFIDGRTKWRSTAMAFETISKLLIGAGSVLSFAAGVYQSTNISFAAGTVSTISVLCLQFSTFCKKESKKSTDNLNMILKKLNLETLPEFNDLSELSIVSKPKPSLVEDQIKQEDDTKTHEEYTV